MKTNKRNPDGHLYKVTFNVITIVGDDPSTITVMDPFTIIRISKWVERRSWWFGRLKWQWHQVFCFSVEKIINREPYLCHRRGQLFLLFHDIDLPDYMWTILMNRFSYINIGKIV